MSVTDRRRRIVLGPGAEFDLIRKLTEQAEDLPDEVLVGTGDDCAVLSAGPLAVTSDQSIEGVHFRREWLTPTEIGYRAGVAALSDLAACAADPLALLLTMGLPAEALRDGTAENIQDGVREAGRPFGAAVIGGDVSRSPGPIFLDVIALGRAPTPVLRSGARPGDQLWVSGTLGASAAALEAFSAGQRPDPDLRKAFAHPVPRVKEALWLAERGVLHAMIDISDGLAGDAHHLAAASGVAVVLDAASLPIAEAVPKGRSAQSLALSGGEDYELCFAAPPGRVESVADTFEADFGVSLTRIGRVVEGEGLSLDLGGGILESIEPAGYDHLSRGPLP